MKINRIITIIMILLQKEKISAKALADKFAVSLRTIYRDIEVIENAGIPITTFSGSHGGIRILKDYKISKRLFTKDDVIILLKGLNLLSSPILNVNEKSASQVTLRWHVQKDLIVIPKSVNPQCIEKNRQIFDFELTEDEMLQIDSLNENFRTGPNPDNVYQKNGF